MFIHDPSSNSTLQGEIRSEEQNWSNLENEEIHLCIETIDCLNPTIDHPESGAQDRSLLKSDQSSIHSDPPDSLDPCKDVSNSSPDNTEQRGEDPLLTQQYQQINLLRIYLSDPPDPCEDVSNPSPTPTYNIEQRDEDPILTQQYQRTNLLRISLRKNRGKPPNRYSPDIGKTSKYPIANHVSTEKLFEPLKAFVHQLSAINIPTKVAEALKDPKWVQAIKKEMKALEKN
ncbi:unnamed protein product [Prunus armeniaca]